MSMTYQDYFLPDVVSNCCSAPMVITDMCSECYEHCEPAEFDEIKPLTNKRVWHTEGKEFLTVVEDYGNGELKFSNGVIGRDEDVNYGKLPKEET